MGATQKGGKAPATWDTQNSMGFPTIAPLENGQEMNTLVSGISSKAKSSHPHPMGNAGVRKHKVHVTKHCYTIMFFV